MTRYTSFFQKREEIQSFVKELTACIKDNLSVNTDTNFSIKMRRQDFSFQLKGFFL